MSTNENQGFVTVPAGQLYFERAGHGPALVLIHSAFLDRREWDSQFSTYAAHHTVVRYDVRGHGRSTGDRTHSSDAEDLAAVLDHLNLPNCAVLGNSDGARIACEFAAGLPDRVTGLILVGGAPHDLDPTKEEQNRFLDTLPGRETRLLELTRGGQKEAALDLILQIWAPQVTGAQRNWLRGIASENYDRFVVFLGLSQPEGRRPEIPVASTLRSSDVRLLSIAGAHDNPALNMMMGRFAQSVRHSHHVELPDGDHTPSVSAAAEFDRVVLDFLARIQAGTPWPPKVV
ncbi:MAG: alpha/beta hydrolase [Thermoplasmata archaeon]|nr:alpha/beta hydrolase [Thermoplasmata archaeon]